MSLMIAVSTLFAMLMVDEVEATSNDELLAKKFSPILILTEETGTKYDKTVPTRVTKPEPVSIMHAQYADSIRFEIYNKLGQQVGGGDWRSFANWDPPAFPNVDFSQNRFAFLVDEYTGKPLLKGQRYAYGQYSIVSYFDYPGKKASVWNDTYFGKGPRAGENFLPNTAYVHIDTTTIPKYKDQYGTVTVIQYNTSGDTLYFKQAPNYEAPTDGGKNNQYDLTIRAVDGTADTTVAVTVSVSNEEERGTIAFTPSQPKAGRPITARLSDPDSSITGASWQWHPLTSTSVLSGTAQAAAYPELSSYTPHAADVGKRLVAQVRYRDGHGTEKSASDTTVAVVAGAPSAPDSLKATPGDKQVVLRWAAADSNGASIQSYSVRDSTVGSKWSA